MGVAGPSGMVAPNFRTARLFGIFNVVFATLLLVFGLCMGGYVATLPMWGKVMAMSQNTIQTQMAAQKKASLAALDEEEKTATTDAEKARIAERRKEIEAGPKTVVVGGMDFSKLRMDDPIILVYSWTDVISGLILNLLMLAGGIGLLHWKPWARSLAVWTAILKVIRLFLVYGFFVIAVIPPYCRRMGEMVSEMMASQPQFGGKPPPFMNADWFTRIYVITYTAFAIGFVLFALIYPAIQLWFLTRPGVKAACSGQLKLPKEPNQPC